jgi:hypothetical protein
MVALSQFSRDDLLTRQTFLFSIDYHVNMPFGPIFTAWQSAFWSVSVSRDVRLEHPALVALPCHV